MLTVIMDVIEFVLDGVAGGMVTRGGGLSALELRMLLAALELRMLLAVVLPSGVSGA